MDQETIRKLMGGNRVAFKQIYDLYFPKLYGYVLRILKSPDVSADVVHDVFLKVWDLRETLTHDMNFNAYIYALTRNHALNVLKQSVTQSRIIYQILIHTYSAYTKNDEDNLLQGQYFETLLAQLPEQQSKVFQLCKMEGYSYADAAKELNIKPGTVNAHLVKAIKNMREMVNSLKN